MWGTLNEWNSIDKKNIILLKQCHQIGGWDFFQFGIEVFQHQPIQIGHLTLWVGIGMSYRDRMENNLPLNWGTNLKVWESLSPLNF